VKGRRIDSSGEQTRLKPDEAERKTCLREFHELTRMEGDCLGNFLTH
jgi:hypothetical protein